MTVPNYSNNISLNSHEINPIFHPTIGVLLTDAGRNCYD